MKKRSYLLLLFLVLISSMGFPQTFQGWVKHHNDSTRPFYEVFVKDKIEAQKRQTWQQKLSKWDFPFKNLLLGAWITLRKGDQIMALTTTNDDGSFRLGNKLTGLYTLEFYNIFYQKFTEQIFIDSEKQVIEIAVNAPVWQAKREAKQLANVPYNKAKAMSDISKGIIKLVELISSHRTYSFPMPQKGVKLWEQKYGFKYEMKFYDVAPYYLRKAQNAYNEVVYAYLSEKLKTNARKKIRQDYWRIYWTIAGVLPNKNEKVKKVKKD